MGNGSDSLREEFRRQVDRLVGLGYHTAAGMTEDGFRSLTLPLMLYLSRAAGSGSDPDAGYLPFAVVVSGSLVPAETQLSLIRWHGHSGLLSLHPKTAADFRPVSGLTIPASPVYLIHGIDRGRASRSVPPADALPGILSSGRTPMTIDEGLSVVAVYPDFLRKNNCFSLLGSRGNDLRVPAIWISADSPKLGWCWNGNPHTWLGSASVAGRIGA